ncbi:MAG TPA: hypothetical protein VFG83_06370 [Kofleriaceae bacterium]|nr:hypothetical protein [Kofleriaceae bacterium]
MKKLILIVALAAVCAVAVWLVRRPDPRPDLSVETRAVLTKLGAGDATTVYAEASPLFRDAVEPERLAGIAASMKTTLGRFVDLGPITEAGVVESATGVSARIVRSLEFEHATVVGEVSFHKVGGVWLLLGFHIPIPPVPAP